jgi:membrane protein implicated in regulation of membrane protease activity
VVLEPLAQQVKVIMVEAILVMVTTKAVVAVVALALSVLMLTRLLVKMAVLAVLGLVLRLQVQEFFMRAVAEQGRQQEQRHTAIRG